MAQLESIERLIAHCEANPGRIPAGLIADARAELDAHRKLSRLLRRLNMQKIRRGD